MTKPYKNFNIKSPFYKTKNSHQYGQLVAVIKLPVKIENKKNGLFHFLLLVTWLSFSFAQCRELKSHRNAQITLWKIVCVCSKSDDLFSCLVFWVPLPADHGDWKSIAVDTPLYNSVTDREHNHFTCNNLMDHMAKCGRKKLPQFFERWIRVTISCFFVCVLGFFQ